MIYDLRGGWFDERHAIFAITDDLSLARSLIIENARDRIARSCFKAREAPNMFAKLDEQILQFAADTNKSRNWSHAYQRQWEYGWTDETLFYEIRRTELVIAIGKPRRPGKICHLSLVGKQLGKQQ